MMHPQLRTAFEQEMLAAQAAYGRQDWREAYRLLERAHILGQHHAMPHTRSHVWFLKVGWQRRDLWEITGQLIRIIRDQFLVDAKGYNKIMGIPFAKTELVAQIRTFYA